MLTLDPTKRHNCHENGGFDGLQQCDLFGRGGSVLDVIVRHGTYYQRMHELLTVLEQTVGPKEPASTKGLAGLFAKSIYPADTPISKRVSDYLNALEQEGRELGLTRTLDRIKRMRSYLNSLVLPLTLDLVGDKELPVQIKTLREALDDDLSKKPIFFPDSGKFENYYLKPDLFGSEVKKAFPDALPDIVGAGDCYATDNDAASIFHCVRVAEFGVRGLGSYLKRIRKLKQPVDSMSWGPVIRELRVLIEDLNVSEKFRKGPTPRLKGKRRDRFEKFCTEALDTCAFLNKNYRIDVAHAKKQIYASSEALTVMNRVEGFMKALAANGIKLAPQLPGTA